MIIGSNCSMSGKEMLLGSVKEALSYGANTFMFYTGAHQNTARKPIDQLRIEEAKELINKSKEEMHKAHAFQTKLITEEASGNSVEVNVLLIHAQDHLMNAMNFQQLAEEFIEVYERLVKLENK